MFTSKKQNSGNKKNRVVFGKSQNLFTKIIGYKKSLIIVFILLVGFLVYKYYSSKNYVRPESIKVEKGTVKEELILSGQIEAEHHAKLSFQGSGKTTWLNVKEGDVVKKGQYLAQLDTTSLRQQKEQAEADLRYYQAVVDRVLDDVKGHDDDETLEQKETRTQAQAAKDKAYRALEIANQNLSNSILRAPFDGVVTNVKFPFTGVNVVFSESLIEIVDNKTIYFEVSADQTEVPSLSVGQKVGIILDSFTDKEFSGEVKYIGETPREGEVGSVYTVKVAINTEGVDLTKVKVGMSGDAKFILNKIDDVLFVPVKFLKTDTKGNYLNLDKKTKKYVEVGLEGEERVEIKGNVIEGEVVYD